MYFLQDISERKVGSATWQPNGNEVLRQQDGGYSGLMMTTAWLSASRMAADAGISCIQTKRKHCQCIEYDGGRLPYCTDTWFQLPVTPGIYWADKVIIEPEAAEEQVLYGDWKQEPILRDA